MSHFTLRSARAHVHTPYLYLRNGLTNRAQICCVVGSLLVTRLSQVMGHISHCGLHVRTCTPHICSSGTAWPIALKFVVHVWPNQLWPNQFARWAVCAVGRLAVCAVGGLRGWRFGRLAVCAVGGLRGWRFTRLAVCVVGGLRGGRFARLAVYTVGHLRSWRFARLAVCAVGG